MTIQLDRFETGPDAAVTKLNRYADAIESLANRVESLAKRFENPDRRCLAVVTRWAKFNDNFQRYRYAWHRVHLEGTLHNAVDSELLSGTTDVFYALNLHEVNNSATEESVHGHSIDQAGEGFPDNYAMQPVGGAGGSTDTSGDCANQVVVEMLFVPTSQNIWGLQPVFSYTNAVDGTCDT